MIGELGKLEQLDLELGIPPCLPFNKGGEEGGGAVAVSPEEAKRRSEAAMVLLDRRFLPAGDDKAVQQEGLNQWKLLYSSLRDMGWPWRVAAYMAWESSPKVGRWPATVHGLATDVLGLTSDRQIYKWREKNPLIEELIVKLRTDPLMAHLPKVWDAFIKVATRADYKSIPAMKMAFEMAGIYREQKEIHLHKHGEGEQDLGKMSYEELLDMERRMRVEQANRGVVEVPASNPNPPVAGATSPNPPGAGAPPPFDKGGDVDKGGKE